MGERFAGRYELLDPLGEGGMASVWRVWDAREGRVVAAKVLRQSDAVSLLRFVREQAVRVASPHVLTPLGWAGDDDRVLFTMPIVDGGSVATLVGDYGPLPPLLAAELLSQLLEALAMVHAARIVHRDVKPANLLLSATGRERPHLLLTDFGIAVDRDGPRFTETGAFVGTPGFVAPEVVPGSDLRPTADLYAAGQVGFFMLTGGRGTPAEQQGRRPTDVPDALWSLLVHLTDPDPDARPGTAREALDRLLPATVVPWDPSVMGEVEIFAHVGPDGEGRPQLLAGPMMSTPTPTPIPTSAPGSTPRPVETTSSANEAAVPTRVRPTTDDPPARSLTPRRRRPSALEVVVVVLALLGVSALLVAWSPWRGGTADGSGSSTTLTPSATATSGSSPTATATPSSPSSPATGTPSGPSGTVSVGTVVTAVGQPCESSLAGVREQTSGGVPVVCQRRSDGTYAWDPPPG